MDLDSDSDSDSVENVNNLVDILLSAPFGLRLQNVSSDSVLCTLIYNTVLKVDSHRVLYSILL